MELIGSLILLVIVIVLIVLFVTQPLTSRQRPEVEDSQVLSSLLAERDRVLNILKELDFDASLGKIPAETYPVQRASLVQQGADILRKIDQCPMLRPRQPSKTPGDNVRQIYLTVLSRPPTAAEMQAVQNYAQTGPVKGRDILVDLTWALLNSAEFLYRH